MFISYNLLHFLNNYFVIFLGTGKTDVAVQIISNLYHNFPEQRTVIVTHSNQALNQLFEKIMALDIDERHLLRLGHGEEVIRNLRV
jgi:intron-binding protein aquarius